MTNRSLFYPIAFTFLFLFVSTLLSAQTDTALLKKHLVKITKTERPRNYKEISTLNQTADYIRENLIPFADTVYFQEYLVGGKTYKNVIAVFSDHLEETIVVGAHYDVYGVQEGADDNASGVAGILELARQLEGKDLSYRIEMVAYTLEEPPYYATEYMGSVIHAKSLVEADRKVFGMVSVEMIGYFDFRKKSQGYPLGVFSLIYGNKGDYITLVNKLQKGKFSRRFNRKFKKAANLKVKKFSGPRSIEGIDFSDHRSYWDQGYSALMITDTSFFRNDNYHLASDKLETLNLNEMAKVVDAILGALLAI